MTPKRWFASNRRQQADRLRMKRRLVDLLGGKCIDCGFYYHLAALDFDHVDPKTKKFTIASKIDQLDYLDLLTEVKKCVIRCANCHRIKTYPNASDQLGDKE